MKVIRNSFWAALALAPLVGCMETVPAPVAAPAPTVTTAPPALVPAPAATAVTTEVKKADAAAPKKLSDDQIAEIKKLPEADQKIALAQMVCPIGEDNLGEMGVPVKVMLNGQPVFLCCSGCEKKAKADPAGTLAKVGKK